MSNPPTEDWGHGPNKPVPYWTEPEIREAMSAVMHSMGDLLKVDAVMAKLKETRR